MESERNLKEMRRLAARAQKNMIQSRNFQCHI
jgi:hypothetical protein